MKIWIAILMSLGYGCSPPITYDIVFQNVRLFDGHEDRGIVNLAIEHDTISAISSATLAGDSVIDLSEKYVIPGLVNAHVHVSSPHHLRAGYPLGILTLLNMHTGEEVRELDWKSTYRDSVGFSNLYGSGHAATVPGGHPNQYSPEMETINEETSIEDWINHRIDQKVDYIKLVRDHHEWMGHPPLPTLSYDQIQKIIDYSHEKGLKVLVHANTLEEMSRISQLGPDGFVHMLEYQEDLPIPDRYYDLLAENDIFVVPSGGISMKSLEGAPPFVRDWVKTHLLDSTQRAEIIREMHEKGVLIVAGNDAQENAMNFGDDYFRELELYQLAGLSNIEILKTATGNAAKAFDLPIGEISVGGKASFVVLKENPLENIENLRTVYQVWKNGRTNPRQVNLQNNSR